MVKFFFFVILVSVFNKNGLVLGWGIYLIFFLIVICFLYLFLGGEGILFFLLVNVVILFCVSNGNILFLKVWVIILSGIGVELCIILFWLIIIRFVLIFCFFILLMNLIIMFVVIFLGGLMISVICGFIRFIFCFFSWLVFRW